MHRTNRVIVVSAGLLMAGGLLLAGCGSDPNGASAASPEGRDSGDPGGSGPDGGVPSEGVPSEGDSSGDDTGQGGDLPGAITCGTQYRPDAEQLDGAESPTLTVDRSDDLVGSSESHEFPNMTLEVTYWGDAPDGRAVMVRVTDNAGAPLVETRYQVGTPLQDIEFAGGHGFTGLDYVDHEEAMLQLWCEAEG